MCKEVRRGFVEKDKKEFSEDNILKLKEAGKDIYYLLNRGYKTKSAATFVGNHYLLSERQRMLLARSLSSQKDLKLREEKRIPLDNLKGKTVHIDGFNTVITLEVALSQGLLVKCQDGTIRDLAGLRGTYHIIDKTKIVVNYILEALLEKGVKQVNIYLDAPVSNSGQLRSLILKSASDYKLDIIVHVISNVDSVLESLEYVITSDAIILNKCISWINLSDFVVANKMKNYWLLDITSDLEYNKHP